MLNDLLVKKAASKHASSKESGVLHASANISKIMMIIMIMIMTMVQHLLGYRLNMLYIWEQLPCLGLASQRHLDCVARPTRFKRASSKRKLFSVGMRLSEAPAACQGPLGL